MIGSECRTTGRSLIRRSHAAAAVLALLSTAAPPSVVWAHAELTSSSPADGARLTTPPSMVRLVFDGELLPEGTGFVATDAAGHVVGDGALDLTVADRNEIRGAVTITGSGTYTVGWTAVAADGHAESDTLSFTVGAAPPGASPDTAMVSTGMRPAWRIAGLVLLLVACALGRTRSERRAEI